MEHITLPLAPRIASEGHNEAMFVIDNCFPGYGVTLGNSLQRVLLSSLMGSAIIAVKIEGVDHEFMTMPGVMEDVITIIMNLKKVRFRISTAEPVRGTLMAKGDKSEKTVTAKLFKFPSDVTLINPDALIATLTSRKAAFKMEVIVQQGLGYRTAAENKAAHPLEAGMIAVDSIFSPIQKVNYRVDNMRVGEQTNYNRLSLTIKTDGSLSPREALLTAANILVGQFGSMTGLPGKKRSAASKSAGARAEKEAPAPVASASSNKAEASVESQSILLKELKLSSRIDNILEEQGVATVGQLVEKGEAALGTMPGIGDKAVKEIRRKLGRLGFILTK